MKRIPVAAAILLAGIALSGCHFKRVVVNERMKTLSAEQVIPGETTWMDVVERYGPPTILSVQENSTSNVSARHLRYASSETKVTQFIFGYYLILPFSWADQQETVAHLFEFDENGLLTKVSKETNDTVWRPLSSPEKGRNRTVEILAQENKP